jgi:hypothetical protein
VQAVKNCAGFSGNPYPQSFCVFTSSTLDALGVGSTVYYLQPESIAAPAGSDVIVVPPGHGNSKVYGHCALDPSDNFNGVCTLDGGTGHFKLFHASVTVTNLDGINYSWSGTFHYSPPN